MATTIQTGNHVVASVAGIAAASEPSIMEVEVEDTAETSAERARLTAPMTGAELPPGVSGPPPRFVWALADGVTVALRSTRAPLSAARILELREQVEKGELPIDSATIAWCILHEG